MSSKQPLAPPDADRKARMAKWRKRLEEIKERIAVQGKPKLSEAEARSLIAKARSEVLAERALGRVPSTGLRHLAERNRVTRDDPAQCSHETDASTKKAPSKTLGSARHDPSDLEGRRLKSAKG